MIDEVLRSLKSGKEATVYPGPLRCTDSLREGLSRHGVRVPRPFGYFNDVLIMELVTDAEGNPVPRLGELDLLPEVAREYHQFLIRQIVRMLSIGLIHGDLSESLELRTTQFEARYGYVGSWPAVDRSEPEFSCANTKCA